MIVLSTDRIPSYFCLIIQYKQPMQSFFLVIFLSVTLLPGLYSQERSPGARLLDAKWKFCRGENTHAADVRFDDTHWRSIDLPHDWSIEPLTSDKGVIGPFTRSSEGNIATGHTKGGSAWYRKTFKLSPKDSDKEIGLYFEGIYMESEIWINGKKVNYHANGYTPFYCNITSSCFFNNQENILAVKVINKGKNSRWYSGSGIYRHVWLIRQGKVNTSTWGIHITTPSITKDRALVSCEIKLDNQNRQPSEGIINIRLIDKNKKTVSFASNKVLLPAYSGGYVKDTLFIPSPLLWDLHSPNLYTAEVSVYNNGVVNDVEKLQFGVRSISFDASAGFRLNGKTVKLKGGCIHHDNGLLGSRAIDRAEERRAELLVANGFNAVRSAHNPPSEKFLEACDRLGLLVIDEAFDQWQQQKNPDDYHRFFNRYAEGDLSSMVLRDRNHPSVIMWSIGNEIPERAKPEGIATAKRLKKIIYQYDKSRPVTAAVNDFWDNPGLKWKDSETTFSELDVAGYNYMWYEYENDHLLHPERVIYGSESVAKEAYDNWNLVTRHPYVIGDFVWTAIDYLGESGIGHAYEVPDTTEDKKQFPDWPWFISGCGDLDICGNKKPQGLYRNVLWEKEKIALVVDEPLQKGFKEKVSYWGWPRQKQSWTWKGHEGELLKVSVFAIADSVELYVNGKLFNRQKCESAYTTVFNVPYHPGEVKAVAFRNGKKTGTANLSTAGNPEKIRLIADRKTITRSANDLSFITVEITDKQGRITDSYAGNVTIDYNGAGRVIASGNSSPVDMASFRSLTPRTHLGRAQVIVQPSGIKGLIKLTVSARNLTPATITIKCE